MTFRIGVVGAGGWMTSAHLPALMSHPDAQVVVVCDVDGERCDRAARRFGIERLETDFHQVWERGPGVDAVVVATPHSTHHAVVAAALEAGVHVLVEKAMTTTAAQAWDLVDLAERHARHLVVGYTYQHTATAAEVRRLVLSGEAGDVVQVVAEFSSGTERWFAGATGDDSGGGPVDRFTYSAAGGGGQAHTQLTHLMGAVHWTLGRPSDRVFAVMDRRGLDVDVVNSLVMTFEGGGSGVAASTGTLGQGHQARHRITWYGTRLVIEQDLLKASARIHGPSGTRSLSMPPSMPTYPVGAPARRFVDLLAGRGPNLGPAREAAWTVSLIEAAHASAASGQAESVAREPYRDEKHRLTPAEQAAP